MTKKALISLIPWIFVATLSGQPHHWHSPSEVVKKIRKEFSALQTYKADFHMETVQNGKTRRMRGECLYKKPGKLRYDFSDPRGDLIISDGKTLWIYLNSLNAVGKQDLTMDKEGDSGSSLFGAATDSGLDRLFRKYHYKFDSIEQPQASEDGKEKFFVLSLEQRVKVGGYEKIILYVDAETYFIKKAVASDGHGKETTLEFSNIKRNPDLEDGVFHFDISGNVKIVNNPLVTDQ